MNNAEIFNTEPYDDFMVTEVIWPSAIVPEEAARSILVELARQDVLCGGVWASAPTRWSRYHSVWGPLGSPEGSDLLGTIEVAYGAPTKYDITIYRVSVTRQGAALGWTVESLCNDALGFGDLGLSTCPRANLATPPEALDDPLASIGDLTHQSLQPPEERIVDEALRQHEAALDPDRLSTD